MPATLRSADLLGLTEEARVVGAQLEQLEANIIEAVGENQSMCLIAALIGWTSSITPPLNPGCARMPDMAYWLSGAEAGQDPGYPVRGDQDTALVHGSPA
jgi:hypothetical protein